ncbi:MAG: peptidase S11, partial [Zoogloea sp.]|nr:peptidase S11 [Zoogloea sp.]
MLPVEAEAASTRRTSSKKAVAEQSAHPKKTSHSTKKHHHRRKAAAVAAGASFAMPSHSKVAADGGSLHVGRDGNPNLRSAAFVVADQSSGAVFLEKNSDAVMPIASITKLMTAMVTLDSHPDLAERITVTDQDVDTLRSSRSRLP